VLGKELAESLERFEVSASSAAKKFKFVPESMPYGRVLVVDDVDANLYVAKGLLSFYDLDVETCKNGRDALSKIKKGKVYDIVFMDQMMPGLSGTETMNAMRNMGYKGTIVALTANALIGQAEEFIKMGFDGFVSKPIQTVHLNTVLTKHIRDKQPPEVLEAARKDSKPATQGDIDEYQNSAELLDVLRTDFTRMHNNSMNDLRSALSLADIETAKRLVHTLKGSAGMIAEHVLAKHSGQLEMLLKEGKIPPDDKLSTLENELKLVLKRIGKPETAAPTPAEILDKDSALAVFNKLEPLLKSGDAECLSLLDDLHMIAETDDLIRQIEDFDFAKALKALEKLKDFANR